ncbi:MAG: hypothetical protein ACTS4T_00615 [Candidatus Hodgkinia cicadicola]
MLSNVSVKLINNIPLIELPHWCYLRLAYLRQRSVVFNTLKRLS